MSEPRSLDQIEREVAEYRRLWANLDPDDPWTPVTLGCLDLLERVLPMARAAAEK